MSNKSITKARPRLRSDERRATIVEAAGRLFGERGYEATTLDDIAVAIPASGSPEEVVRTVLEVWLDYVESHLYAWRMLFRDRGGGPDIEAFRREVQDRARAVLAELLDQLTRGALPRREREPLA